MGIPPALLLPEGPWCSLGQPWEGEQLHGDTRSCCQCWHLVMQNHRPWTQLGVYQPLSHALSQQRGSLTLLPGGKYVWVLVNIQLCTWGLGSCYGSRQGISPGSQGHCCCPQESSRLQAGVDVCPGLPGTKLSLCNGKPTCELESNEMETQTWVFPQAICTNLFILFLCSRVIFFRTLAPSSCSQCLALQYQLSL